MRLRTMTIALAFAFTTVAAHGEMALLANGRVLKVSSWEIEGVSIDLQLTAGGTVTMPLDQVERIVDDEIVPEPEAKAATGASPLARGTWRFDDGRPPLFESDYDAIILEAARKFDVDAALVSAVIKAESGYRRDAVSAKGARGLMQLMPATAKRFGVTDAFDASSNIHAGTRYLHELLEEFGSNAELALAAYNAGESTVKRYDGVPPYRETIDYIARISRYLEAGETRLAAVGSR